MKVESLDILSQSLSFINLFLVYVTHQKLISTIL